jgi:hypothetical protein
MSGQCMITTGAVGNQTKCSKVVLLHELNDYVVNYIEHGANEMLTVKKSLACIETKALLHFIVFLITFSSNI